MDKKPVLQDFETSGQMGNPHGGYDFEGYANALNEYIKATTPNQKVIQGIAMKSCPFGAYRVYWKSGGNSLATVGNMHDGTRWIAPTNWTSAEDPTGRIDDVMVESIEKMVLLVE